MNDIKDRAVLVWSFYHAKRQHFDFGAKQVRKCKYEIFVRF